MIESMRDRCKIDRSNARRLPLGDDGRERKEEIMGRPGTPASPSGLFLARDAHGNCSNLKMRGFTDRSPYLRLKNIFKLNFNL